VLDRERADRTPAYRRALLAVLVFAGLRIDEALSLRWCQVSLPSRTMRVGSKTDAGHRTIDLLPVLVDELLELRATSGGEPDDLVFRTATGGKQSASNVRNRLLSSAVEKANATLAVSDLPGLPDSLTPHSMRRTFISILLALGGEVPYVMEQAGHADPKVTLGIYARVMRRSPEDKTRLRALVDGGTVPARSGTSADPVSSRFGTSGAETLSGTGTEATA
jgi:integrase